MSAAREMVGVETMGEKNEALGGKRSRSPRRTGVGLLSEAARQPWPRLVREVAPVYEPSPGSPIPEASPLPAKSDALDPGAPDPDDELFTLGERCAEAYMRADALQYQAMRLLVEFHQREGWRDTGFSSTAEWLAWRIGIRPGAARERLRTALALDDLPQISEAMERGALSFTKVRALTRVATPDNEDTLLEFAQAGSAANLERLVRGWKSLDRKSELTAEQVRHRTRRFSAFVDVDGMVVVRGRLDPEVGAMLMRAVEAANDALFREEGSGVDEANTELQEMTPEQRRADAMGLIAERALAAGFGAGASSGASSPSPISGSRAERYQVMLHVDEATLQESTEPGQSELEDGTRVSAETSRRLACDCGVVKIGHQAAGGVGGGVRGGVRGEVVTGEVGTGEAVGEVVGAGRRTRTVPPALRRALEARDRGCRFPGCGLRFTEAHHIQHWADGGETSLRNLALLCRTHHRAVHEGRVQICMDVRGQVAFFTPKGKTLFDAPPRRGIWAEGARPGMGTHPAHPSGAGKWRRDRDIPYAIEAKAWETLESG